MDVERQRLANAIFLDACELSPGEINAFVQLRCGDDRELQQRVLAMLAADADQTFLEVSIQADDAAPAAIVGERGYRLIRQIGEGGMGQVYLAERDDGSFRQRVAIKLIHRNQAGGREALRRFRAERQILAALTHPNIARLIDGGTLANGAPYLVMEYIEGERIDGWCERQALSVPERLGLFLKVCDAVQSAHQSLIVHRDLKPSNILVTAQGEPKLLDFGIAKVLNAGTFAQSMANTRTGDLVMTLAYASPEQVRGEAIGTGSDVYALGVVLYELLTGSLPYQAAHSDPVSLARAVCEEQPDPPSRERQRGWSDTGSEPTLPHRRVADSQRSLRRQLRGDLDAIVLKALRKEPTARYRSVEQFAADIRRFLDGLPVHARRGSTSYRLRKFVFRHRWPIGATALLFSVLMIAVVLLRIQLARTELERDKAERVTDFMVRMFERSDPLDVDVRDSVAAVNLTVREVMDSNAPLIATELADNPQVQASLLAVIARIYDGLSLPDSARKYAMSALEQLRRAGQLPSRSSVQVRLYLVQSLNALSEWDGAMEQAQAAVDEARKLFKGDDFDLARALRARGSMQRNLGKWQAARIDTESALAMFQRVRSATDSYVAGTTMDMATIAAGIGDFPACERWSARALALLESDPAPGKLVLSSLRATRATCLVGLGDLAAAEVTFRNNVDANSRTLGADSKATGEALNDLGNLLNQQGRYAEAEPLLRRSLAIQRAALGADNPALVAVLLNLSTSVFELGKKDEGIELQTQVLALVPRSQDKLYATALNNLGFKLYQMGKLKESEARFREALAVLDKVAPTHPDRALTMSSLGRLLTETGRAVEGQGLIESALNLRLSVLPADHWAIAESRSLLGANYVAQGRRAEAESLLREGLTGLVNALGADHLRSVRARQRLEAWIAAEPPVAGGKSQSGR